MHLLRKWLRRDRRPRLVFQPTYVLTPGVLYKLLRGKRG